MKPANAESMRYAVAPGSSSFQLHTLGWRAFQDLSAAILREVWGQSVQAFADTRDAGRDGAFYGKWSNSAREWNTDLPNGPFVVQCKHMASPDATLTPSSLQDEYKKVPRLVRNGLCRSYVLLTNARITGSSEEAIRSKLTELGVENPLVLGGGWISQTISMSRKLRMFVPRVYGLGDLSNIFDERAYDQARALLDYLKNDLQKFVPTDAYRRAAQALDKHRFILLLGEPAAGKTLIAATLAMATLDNSGSPIVKVNDASELTRHWNPNEPRQLFWADDAFGSVRYDAALAADWSRRMHSVMAAVAGGAYVILTSRSYIYNEARHLFKTYEFPRLLEGQVVVQVEDLTHAEREEILYNHIRYGDQPRKTRAMLKPELQGAANVVPFRPELARRLGLRAFTRDLHLDSTSVRNFMASPVGLLKDVLAGLPEDALGTLALVYATPGRSIVAPIAQDDRDILDRFGATIAGASKAFAILDGTFLRRAARPGSSTVHEVWDFHHPTLREAFAAYCSDRPYFTEILLRGMPVEQLLQQVDAGGEIAWGTVISVPPDLYELLLTRLDECADWLADDLYSVSRYAQHGGRMDKLLAFIARRASTDFALKYVEREPRFIERLAMNFRAGFGYDMATLDLFLKLHDAGVVPKRLSTPVSTHLIDWAADTPEADWLDNPSIRRMIDPGGSDQILRRVQARLTGLGEAYEEQWASGRTDPEEEPEDFYEPLRIALTRYRLEFAHDEETLAGIDASLEAIPRLIEEERDFVAKYHRHAVEPDTTSGQNAPSSQPDRSVFDDVDL